MKKLAILVFALFLSIGVFAQIKKPVKWSYAAKKVGKNEAVIFLKATIEPGWHIYSAYQKDGGPVKTSFKFNPSKEYTVIGNIVEPKPKTVFEKNFDMQVGYFEKTVIFQQKVKLSKAQTQVTGTLEFMVCNDHECIPPAEVNFSVAVK